MTIKKIKISLLLVLAFVSIVGCTSSIEKTAQPSQIPPTPSQTTTLVPPTLTFTPSPEPPTVTPTETFTPLPTDTLVPTSTFTDEPAILTTDLDLGCRFGAGTWFSIQQFIAEGTELNILGQLEDGSWWLVDGLDNPPCWVMDEIVTIKGKTASLPVFTPPPPPTETPTPTQGWLGISYVLIAENTGGYFGCGDDLRFVYPGIKKSGDSEDKIVAALNALFSNHNKYFNGLYNPLYQSSLKAQSAKENGSGWVVVQLHGKLVKPKDECESKRMHAQVWQTVANYTDLNINIYVNNAKLGDLLELP